MSNESSASTPESGQALDSPFLMATEGVTTIAGRGTVVTGQIARGTIKVGEEVEIVGLRDTQTTLVTMCTDVKFGHLSEGRAGENGGVLLRGIARDDVERGQVLTKPGCIKSYTRFEAEVHLLTEDEGGRQKPFDQGDSAQFRFHMRDVTGKIELPEGVETPRPGGDTNIMVRLIWPVAMEYGTRFEFHVEGIGKLGAGTVIKTLE